MATSPTKRLDEDEREFIRRNMGLVYSIAKKMRRCRLPVDDRVQHGVLGLMRAAEDYDPTIARFSTYATRWIRQSILRAAHEDTTIRTPHWTSYRTPAVESSRSLIVRAEHARRARGRGFLDADLAPGGDDPAARITAADEADLDRKMVRRAMAILTEDEREHVIARFQDGATVPMLARRDRVTKQAIHAREKRILDKMRRYLGPEHEARKEAS